MQGIRGIGSHVAVGVVGERVAIVPRVGIRKGRGRAGTVVAGQGGDVSVFVVGDRLLREGVGGRGAAVVLPSGEAVRPVIGEAVGAGRLAGLGPGPTADIARVLRHGTGDGRAVVAQGHREDVGRSLEGRARGQPALDVPVVGGGDGGGPAAGRGGLQTREVAIEKRQSHKLEWP